MWSTDLFSSGKGWNTAYYRYGRDRYRQFDDLQKAEISDKVLKVVMDNEITNIPDGMFKNYKNIKEVELPNVLKS